MIPGTNLHQFDVHNDGYFSHLPLTYVDGVILEMAVRMMPYEEFAVCLEEKCGCYFQEISGRLNLYLDHLDMNLSEYLSQAITYDMDACISKTISHPKKRYCNDFSLDEMVDWAEMEVDATYGVEARTSTTDVDATDGVNATDDIDAADNGKEKVSQDATEVVQTRRSTVENDSETEYDSDDDSDYQLVDYLSPGEEELIELRNRIKANREANAKVQDNLVSEMNEPNNKNSMPADNVRGETFEEHDIYMNRLLKSLNTADKDGISEDPFIFVKNMWRGIQCMIKQQTVGEKYISVTQFKECQTYYALANGFSLWYEMSGKVRVVSRCGQRTLRLSDPEKDSNPGSTINLGVTGNPDGKTYLNRFYVCFAGLADEWKAWCRKIIA
ncbi:hypothetical protein Tco_1024188 [Tanacetum coccineum]